MRQAGTLPKQLDAENLANYLLTEGIETRLEAQDGHWVLWVLDEEHVDRAVRELAQFEQSPDDPRYAEATREANRLRRESEKKEQAYRRNVVDLRTGRRITSNASAPLTIVLIVASVLVTIAANFGKNAEFTSYLYFHLPSISRGEVWRLVAPIFLHLGIIHLIFNMYWLYQLGGQIELRQGTWRLAWIVLLTAVISNLSQEQMVSPFFGGMSGVVYGLFGYIWVKTRYDPLHGFYLPPNTAMYFILWFFLCLSGVVGPVANYAHGVGLVVGAAIAYTPVLWRQVMRR